MIPSVAPATIDTPAMRQGGPDLLSLALMDARNHTLHLLGRYEAALGADDFEVPLLAELNPPLWELGHVGWYQEWWLARNVQRHRGASLRSACCPSGFHRARADTCGDPSRAQHAHRWELELPDFGSIKTYLLDTLETSLELLERKHRMRTMPCIFTAWPCFMKTGMAKT
jgi:iron(II)-dependent oxidoreductase